MAERQRVVAAGRSAIIGNVQTTPLWVPLVVAAVGLAGTVTAGIASVLITQRRSDRREERAWALERQREETAWTRERRREQQRWQREDEARTFEHRRDAYAEFYESIRAMGKRAYDHGFGFTERPELPVDWHWQAFQKLQRLRLYADRRAATSAAKAYNAAWRWGNETKHADPDDPWFYQCQADYDAAETQLFLALRQGLGLPDGDSPMTTSCERPCGNELRPTAAPAPDTHEQAAATSR